MPEAARTEVWASGEGYERYVGRWSRPVAREFVRWLAAPARGRWLDVGCGTGALVETVLSEAAPAAVPESTDPMGTLPKHGDGWRQRPRRYASETRRTCRSRKRPSTPPSPGWC
jgi:hypothetical protein